nr:penicillin-binding protein 1A-like [Nerophis lumbriciformis]
MTVSTRLHLRSAPSSLPPAAEQAPPARLIDRHGEPLTSSREGRWNLHDSRPFHRFPKLLVDAFVMAEDQRFFAHRGVDWRARSHAAVQNLRALRVVRGASTITEQAVRIAYPRPRTFWSRWLESFEAGRLERRFDKAEILEFYLNQVPYSRQRRGVAEAARAYFDRDLDTLSVKETLALAVLVRSPSRLDLERGNQEIQVPIERLARRMHDAGMLAARELDEIERTPLLVVRPQPLVDGAHFVRWLRPRLSSDSARSVRTTLDANLQRQAQAILDRRLAELGERRVGDGAVLVIDHQNDEILAWVNGGGFAKPDAGQVDKVLALRQPGSTLKPFVYATALESGWTAATVVDDAPLTGVVGHGMHQFRNYSRHYYGPLRVRQALANSLNVPAVKALAFAGRGPTLERLRELGFATLNEHPEHYGDGLALGTGEVSLYSLVSAYAALARGGELRPVSGLAEAPSVDRRRVFSAEVAGLIGSILSDAEARQLEFGSGSVIDLPIETAVKTGTSTDYRDAWAVGFSHRYTVGVWMGNVDGRPMAEVTGSTGPGLVLRAVFAEAHRHQRPAALGLSRRLARHPICRQSGARPSPTCPTAEEWFRPGREPLGACLLHGDHEVEIDGRALPAVRLTSPTPGLHLALDPRIPDPLERFPLRLADSAGVRRVEWIVDGRVASVTRGEGEYLWPVERGSHSARARVWLVGQTEPRETQQVNFYVR